MRLLSTLLMAAAVTLTAVSSLEAQQPGGRGRGGFPGFGGGGGGGDAFILGMPEVQKELTITDEQKGLIDDMFADMRERGGQRPDFGSFRDLSEEERQKRFEEMRKAGEERAKQTEEAIKVILDEKQFARYEELRLQRQGIGALGRPEVADKLALTQEQKDKLEELRNSMRPQRGEGGGRPGGDGARPAPGADGARPDFQAMMAEFQKRREKMEADSLAVLTPEQMTKWEGMLGKKFEFPAPQFGGRGPGQGGPGGQGRPGGNRPPSE